MEIVVFDCGLDGLTFRRPSLCKPEFAADADLKTIVSRFLKTGQIPPARPSVNVDAINSPQTFEELQQFHATVSQRFDMLPDEERAKYQSVEDWVASLGERNETSKPDNSITQTTTESSTQISASSDVV